jgi:hypothetical protein
MTRILTMNLVHLPQPMTPLNLGCGNITHRYPVWASLARDYLAVMASSVSSERAFSSAGITISKRRNRLKGDIVEALQCLKCMIRKNLIFREDPASTIAKEIEDLEDVPENAHAELKPESSWDEILLLDEEVDAEG